MVLTQQAWVLNLPKHIFRFHTTMVLTQPGVHQKLRHASQDVSIPLWFLRNGVLVWNLGLKLEMFPYHYGSYATGEKKEATHREHRFHTTMVLTQPSYRRKEHHNLQVSIPLWFLRNGERGKGYRIDIEFPYHYGSYATDIPDKPIRPC
mgnify:FL=1